MIPSEVTLMIALGGFITALTSLVPAVTAYVRSHTNEERLNRQSEAHNKLANGEGDAKIDARLRAYGLIANLPGAPTTRSTDLPAPISAPAPQNVTQRIDSNAGGTQ